ncbi:hypothetical protein, partial [uncultured Rikenella sp.]|uniref:hypothetical protein n=1 Tax=uncultured Rikenella sp. TaxID=368003 RepID=UPI0025F7E25D
AQPNSPPRIRLTAAPLSLRHLSHFSRALAEILSKRALTRLDDFLFQQSPAGILPRFCSLQNE